MAICRHYPDEGGGYASVHHRSKVIAIVGAFLLVADYIVTASISALFGFQYVGVPHPGPRPEARKRRSAGSDGFRIGLAFVGVRGECPRLSLPPRCLSESEAC